MKKQLFLFEMKFAFLLVMHFRCSFHYECHQRRLVAGTMLGRGSSVVCFMKPLQVSLVFCSDLSRLPCNITDGVISAFIAFAIAYRKHKFYDTQNNSILMLQSVRETVNFC